MGWATLCWRRLLICGMGCGRTWLQRVRGARLGLLIVLRVGRAARLGGLLGGRLGMRRDVRREVRLVVLLTDHQRLGFLGVRRVALQVVLLVVHLVAELAAFPYVIQHDGTLWVTNLLGSVVRLNVIARLGCLAAWAP